MPKTASIDATTPGSPRSRQDRSGRAATIVDVAKRAGVSIKTVSRVMNAEGSVHASTREQVLQAVAELNYRPKLSARSLAGARSFLIGLLYYDPSAAYVAGVQKGATLRCREAGYHLVVESLDHHAQDIGQQVERMVATLRPDGMILAAPISQNPQVIAVLEASLTPYVLISPGAHTAEQMVVSMDDLQAAQQVTEALLRLGHKRIGFVSGASDQFASEQRYRGYLQALANHHIEPQTQWVVQGDFTFPSGVAAANQLLASTPPPTAIFASNDDMALGVMAAAQRLGLKVPAQLSVVGFDDIPAASLVWPELTTVRQPVDDMAIAAVNMLIAKEPAQTLEQVLPHRVVMRGSTAAPPAE